MGTINSKIRFNTGNGVSKHFLFYANFTLNNKIKDFMGL